MSVYGTLLLTEDSLSVCENNGIDILEGVIVKNLADGTWNRLNQTKGRSGRLVPSYLFVAVFR